MKEEYFAGIISTVIILAAVFGWTIAYAQLPPGLQGKQITVPMICGPTHIVEKFLELDHGEVPVVNAKSTSNHMATIYSDPLHASTSIAIHRPDGESCVMWGTKCAIGQCFMPTKNMVIQ